MDLTEREIAQDLLMMEKQLNQSYDQTESYCANRQLREAIRRMHAEGDELYSRLFHTMHQKGWIQTPVAGQQEIESAILYWEQQTVKQPELGGEHPHEP